ncbi:lysine 5,6-aminomutase reactivase ATPase KamC [Vallitalea okinawensis]|uniref:lysine 5,6-aminomutase reactivase ATPase KamC n=1 Tax=Vallitalea okinawensis TaxID=2078660 RepID=UPI000CFD9227|nr:hypothetical protein [Vallitalea okinawensis]
MKASKLQQDLQQIIAKLHLLSPYGKEQLVSLVPYKKEEEKLLQKEFDALDYYQNLLKDHLPVTKALDATLRQLKNIIPIIDSCEKDQTLDLTQLFEIKQQVMVIQNLRSQLKKILEKPIIELQLANLDQCLVLLDPDQTGLPTFYIPNDGTPQLQIARLEKRLVEKAIAKATTSQDREELMTKRQQLVIEEKEEERCFREQLTMKLKPSLPALKANIEKLGLIDIHLAKVRLQLAYGGTRPNFDENDQCIVLKGLYHPIIVEELAQKGRHFTSVDMRIEQGVTVITGANMGGKTIALRTLLLNLTLAHMGFYVFASFIKTPYMDYFDFVYEDMNQQSGGLSSFGTEVIQLKEVLSQINRKSGIIAIDEFARGTNPTEGQLIVKGLIQYLKKYSGYFVITSHYDHILMEGVRHYQVVGLQQLDMPVKDSMDDILETIGQMMDYRLKEVNIQEEVPKEGIKIAKLLGLDQELIHTIEKIRREESHG